MCVADSYSQAGTRPYYPRGFPHASIFPSGPGPRTELTLRVNAGHALWRNGYT